jgi:transcriptional regulator with PAS, ATPase and Fis domain
MQVKLLRAIESGEYTPVGSNKARKADIRIIAALNKEPLEMVNKGLMREDFFYRISVIHITLPELKDRREDIPLLTEHLLRSYTHGEEARTIPPNVMNALMNYDWPGNVRELQNVLQRYLTVKTLDFMNISSENGAGAVSDDETGQEEFDLQTRLEEFEKKIILKTLEKFRWNRTKAASSLGISRRSLFRRMKKLGI